MKSTVESVNPTKVKLVIDADFDDLRSSLDQAYKSIGGQIVVPGFRRGKVPPQVIDQRVGRGAVLEQAINDALPDLYGRAVNENKLTPVGRPEIEVSEINDRTNVVFAAEVEVRPDFTLPDTDNLSASVDDLEVSDEDVDAQLDLLRERFATLTPVERPAEDGDQVTIDLSASDDGRPLEEAQAEGLTYDVGSGSMLDGMDEAIRGLAAGEKKTFTSQLLGGELAGRDVDVEVAVTAVKNKELPELDDDFAQEASQFDTIDEVREDARERLVRRERLEQAARARDAVLDALLGQVEIDIPEGLLADEVHAREHSITDQLQGIGMSREQYLESQEQTAEEFDAATKTASERAIRSQFVLDTIAEQHQFGVENEELSQHIVRHAQQSGVSPEEFAQHAMSNDMIPGLMAEIIRAKALAYLVEHATVTDASGQPIELQRLLPDGTYAPEDDAPGAAGDSDAADAEDKQPASVGAGSDD